MWVILLLLRKVQLFLLLFLIKKNEIDIYDIPIAKIAGQYLEYLELMELMDLDIAGEFLVMAAEENIDIDTLADWQQAVKK